MMNFSAETWLTICFFLFFAIFIRFISRAIDNFFLSKETDILELIQKSQDVFEKAKAHLKEAKDMYDQIEDAKKIVFDKEQKELEFEIKTKEKKLKQLISSKKTRFKNTMISELKKFKNETYDQLFSSTKENVNDLIDQNDKLYKKFTDLTLKKN